MTEFSFFRLGLIGWPVEHSLSPVIHHTALEACELEGDYRLFPIPPMPKGKQDLLSILNSVRHGALSGINVTVPHKQNVIPFLDRLTAAAENIGAVNTIFMDKDTLTGDNTDGDGFLTDLKAKLPFKPQNKTALVLGAGGSSRAVAYALGNEGWQVSVAARRVEQAHNLVEELKRDQSLDLSAYPLASSILEPMHPELIVNTTPVGMSPNIFESPWPLIDRFPEGCFIYDLIYNPGETMLTKQARRSGLIASNGLGMLVEQAALAFQRWTGLTAPRQAVYAAVKEKTQTNHPTREVEK